MAGELGIGISWFHWREGRVRKGEEAATSETKIEHPKHHGKNHN